MWLVVRSSERCLEQLQEAMGHQLYRPVRTERRRARGRRSVATVTLQQYPGYAFVRSEASGRLLVLRARHSFSLLLCASGQPAIVPDEQLEYARMLERETTAVIAHGHTPGSRVEITSGPLSGIQGIVVESGRSGTRLSLPVSPIPLLVAHSMLRVVAPPT